VSIVSSACLFVCLFVCIICVLSTIMHLILDLVNVYFIGDIGTGSGYCIDSEHVEYDTTHYLL
jgi:hypothetical protein